MEEITKSPVQASIANLVECIAAEIATFLSRRNETTPPTKEEILSAIYKQKTTTATPKTNIPHYLTGTGSTVGNNEPKAKSGRKKSGPSADYGQCIYRFLRAPRKGERCSNPAADDHGYCRGCVRKTGVKSKIGNGTSSEKRVVPPTLITDNVSARKNISRVNLRGTTLEDGLFHEKDNGFLCRRDSAGRWRVKAVRKDGEKDREELTPQEIEAAKSLHLLDEPLSANKKVIGSNLEGFGALKMPTREEVIAAASLTTKIDPNDGGSSDDSGDEGSSDDESSGED